MGNLKSVMSKYCRILHKWSKVKSGTPANGRRVLQVPKEAPVPGPDFKVKSGTPANGRHVLQVPKEAPVPGPDFLLGVIPVLLSKLRYVGQRQRQCNHGGRETGKCRGCLTSLRRRWDTAAAVSLAHAGARLCPVPEAREAPTHSRFPSWEEETETQRQTVLTKPHRELGSKAQ